MDFQSIVFEFIYLDIKHSLIVVADSKYHITRYDMMAHRADFSNFVSEYEPKLQNKINFVQGHRKLVEEHFENITGKYIDLKNYDVYGLFLVNTPIIYNYVGRFIAYHLPIFKSLVKGEYQPKVYELSYKDRTFIIEEPYFKNPVEAANLPKT